MSRTDRHKPYLVQVADMNGKTAPHNWRDYQWRNRWKTKRVKKLRQQGYSYADINTIIEQEIREKFGDYPPDDNYRSRYFKPNSGLRTFYANKENKRERRKGKRIDPDAYEDEPKPKSRSIAWFID